MWLLRRVIGDGVSCYDTACIHPPIFIPYLFIAGMTSACSRKDHSLCSRFSPLPEVDVTILSASMKM